VTAIFRALCRYATFHFNTEERYLQASGYDGLSRQRSEHTWFIEKLLELDRTYDVSDPILLGETLSFLEKWFVGHIMTQDQAYAGWVKSFRHRAEIRAIIFDFGKVIADYDHGLFVERLAAVCAMSADELAGRFREEGSLFNDFEVGAISPAQFLGEMSRVCGHALSEAVLFPIFTDIFTPIPSTCELIRKLKGRYRLGLISNTNPWHYQHGIQDSEAFPLFDTVTLSFQAKALKPSPRIFEDALEKLDLVSEECVFIDDIPAFVEAANGLRFHGIQYRGPKELLEDLEAMNILF
jgi:putative hydrolase of the HAD superfamily